MARSTFALRTAAVGLSVLVLLLFAAPSRAGTANAGVAGTSATNPLAGLPWGNYTGPQDEIYSSPAYQSARGRARRLLDIVARGPRMRWYGPWYADSVIQQTVRDYLANVTGGDPNVMAQVAVFRLHPWEGNACQRLPTAGEQASYKYWINQFANGIGTARVALVLQPDLPFAFCVPDHSQLPLRLVAYAARLFSALPHTTVYIDAGAGDWLTAGQAVSLLRAAGVRYARGFALNATHYDPTGNEVRFAAAVARGLAKAGFPNRHAVINTSSNGHGFTHQQYHGSNYDNAPVCTRRTQQRCVSLGIPPTTDVASSKWGLSRATRQLAARYVDAYLWIGRPWLFMQNDPFDPSRTQLLAATTPL